MFTPMGLNSNAITYILSHKMPNKKVICSSPREKCRNKWTPQTNLGLNFVPDLAQSLESGREFRASPTMRYLGC